MEKDSRENIQSIDDPFYSEENVCYLSQVIDGIEDGSRPLVEHDLIVAESGGEIPEKSHNL